MVVAAVVAAALVARLPQAVLTAEPWLDDGTLYTRMLANGPEAILHRYADYLVVGIQSIFYIETLVPPYWAPLVGNLAVIAVFGAIAAYIVMARLPWPAWWSLIIALLIAIVPSSRALPGSVAHLMWPLTLWVAVVAVAADPPSRPGRIAESVALVVAGLTGLTTLLMAPLYLLRPVRRRVAIVTLTAAIQAFMILTWERPGPDPQMEWQLLPAVILVRVFAVPLMGSNVAQSIPSMFGIVAGGVIAAALGYLLLRTHGPIRLWLLGVAFLVPLATVAASRYELEQLMTPTWAQRYFWLSAVAWAGVITLSLRRTEPVAIALAVLLAGGIVAEFRLSRPVMDWATNSACIGGPRPCTVPVGPEGTWGDRWHVRYDPARSSID